MAKVNFKVIDQAELLNALKEKIYSMLTEEQVDAEGEPIPIHARDLAAIGNLVLRLQEREDKLIEAKEAASGNVSNVVAFPALPPIPNKLKAL